MLLYGQQSNIYGAYWDYNNSVFNLASIDVNTSVITTIDSIHGVTQWSGSSSTFDYTNGHYIFKTNLGITIVNSQTSSIVNTFQGISNLSFLEYDYVTNKVYGVYSSNSIFYLTSVDINSGVITTINSIQGVTQVSGASSTFDYTNGYYIIITNLGITVINSQNGSIVNTFPSINNLGQLEYDDITKIVYGVYWDYNNSVENLSSIDINSGAITTINSIQGVTSVSSGTSTFDYDNGYYIIITNLGITVINSQNGSIVNTFPSISNLGGIEYFGKIRKSTKDVTTSIGNNKNDPFSDNVTIYPNPVSNEIVIDLIPNTLSNMNFIIYNSLGDMVYNRNYMVTENTKNTINLDMNNLPKGLYILKINSLDGTISDIRNFVKID